MPIHDLAVSIGALALTIALLIAARPFLRRLSARQSGGKAHHMTVAASLPLDRVRRLTLVRIGDAHVLLLTGGGGDQILPWHAQDTAFQSAVANAMEPQS